MEGTAPQNPALSPKEGHFVLHLFYRVDRQAWDRLAEREREAGLERLRHVVAEAATRPQVQLLAAAMIARADLGFMLIGPDLHVLQELEKRIAASLGAGALVPVFTFFSMTERSEYMTTEAEYAEELKKEIPDEVSPQFEEKLAAFRTRMAHYAHDRLNPTLPPWEFFAFYPMSKRRIVGQNWYALEPAQRRGLMKGHATVGRKYSGRILQIISGSTGLDDWEWGVSLFAHDPYEVKAIVYEMRFDEVTAQYGEFGPFYTGLILPIGKVIERLGLTA